MYGNIGLTTARGSGTNGYVQRNMSFVKDNKFKYDNKNNDDHVHRYGSEYLKEPNEEILEHARKRKIEVQCLELEDELLEKG